jgi:hypothetical protein
MDAQHVLKSWTIRINAAAAALGLVLLSLPDAITQPEMQSLIVILPEKARHAIGTAVTIVAALNFLLRFKTNAPVTVKKASNDSPAS